MSMMSLLSNDAPSPHADPASGPSTASLSSDAKVTAVKQESTMRMLSVIAIVFLFIVPPRPCDRA